MNVIIPYPYTHTVELLKNPQYYLALTAVFRDEGRFLKEWIEFYKLMGVEHFYLYNHLSEDNYMEVLSPYIQDGIVELIDLNQKTKNAESWNRLQCSVYLHTVNTVKNDVEWLIIVDIDEFMFPIKEPNLKSLLTFYDDFAALSVNWRMFGSSDVQRIKDNETMIEKLVMRASDQGDLHVKSVVKPRYVETFNNQHFAILQSGYAQVTENYQTFYGPFTHFPSYKIITINHYWTKDWDFFNTTRLSRVYTLDNSLSEEDKNARIDILIQRNKQYSAIYDDSILRFAPALRAQMFKDQVDASKMLCSAVMQKKYEDVKNWLSKGADVNYCDKEYNATVLYIAVENNQLAIAKLLLDMGADPDIKAGNGVSPLYWAVQSNYSEIALILLKHGADIETKFHNIVTPLYVAAALGHDDLVEIFLCYNASQAVRVNGNSPMQIADSNGYDHIIQLLQGEINCDTYL